MSFLDQKQRIATEEDLRLPWSGNKDNFSCGFCGHKFKVGDTWRFVFTNDSKISGTAGNPLCCKECDDTNENLIKKLSDTYQEFMQGKFLRFRRFLKR